MALLDDVLLPSSPGKGLIYRILRFLRSSVRTQQAKYLSFSLDIRAYHPLAQEYRVDVLADHVDYQLNVYDLFTLLYQRRSDRGRIDEDS